MLKKALTVGLLGFGAWWIYRQYANTESYFLTVDSESGDAFENSGSFKTVAFGIGEEILSMVKDKPNLNMGLSLQGLAFIKSYEELKKVPYYATKIERERGILTIGYGITYSDKNADLVERYKNGITTQEAETMFLNRVAVDELAIAKGVKVKLSQNQFDALVSLRFNLGALGVAAPTLYNALQAGDFEKAADSFMLYVRQAGVVLNGLYRRRAAEMNIFRFGKYENN